MAAIWGRWVTHSTCRPRATWNSFRATLPAARPDTPVSTSSKIRVVTWSFSASTFFSASMIRASSPPEAMRWMGLSSSPRLADMRKRTSSMPVASIPPGQALPEKDTWKRTLGMSSSSSSPGCARTGPGPPAAGPGRAPPPPGGPPPRPAPAPGAAAGRAPRRTGSDPAPAGSGPESPASRPRCRRISSSGGGSDPAGSPARPAPRGRSPGCPARPAAPRRCRPPRTAAAGPAGPAGPAPGCTARPGQLLGGQIQAGRPPPARPRRR